MQKTAQPVMRRQKRPSGRHDAYVMLNGRRVMLGPWGHPDTGMQYNRTMAEWYANGRRLHKDAADLTVAECVEVYAQYAADYYQESRSSLEKVKYALGALVKLYAAMPASDFTATHLRAVRETMVHANLVRQSINERIAFIVKMFRYCASLDLIPTAPYEKCRTLEPLRRGRCHTKAERIVAPVSREHVELTIQRVNRSVAAVIRLLLLTGARAGEICGLRHGDINTRGDCWTARLDKHKTAHKGKVRTLVFGPEAQRILTPFLLRRREGEYLFSPKDHWEERHESARTPRRAHQADTPRQTDRTVGDRYDAASLRKCIRRAAKSAGVPDWSPHQLRHTRATELRDRYGIEAAAAVLGHASVKTTEIYARLNEAQTTKIMAEIG